MSGDGVFRSAKEPSLGSLERDSLTFGKEFGQW
jgi:hypothetical protein